VSLDLDMKAEYRLRIADGDVGSCAVALQCIRHSRMRDVGQGRESASLVLGTYRNITIHLRTLSDSHAAA
jgi:hypothetical protein